MLSIRDEEVRTLAQDLMHSTGAPTITAAIKRALKNELARTKEQSSVREKLEALQRKALGMAKHAPDRDYVDSRDDLWER
jgi:antitoxin VapB